MPLRDGDHAVTLRASVVPPAYEPDNWQVLPRGSVLRIVLIEDAEWAWAYSYLTGNEGWISLLDLVPEPVPPPRGEPMGFEPEAEPPCAP